MGSGWVVHGAGLAVGWRILGLDNGYIGVYYTVEYVSEFSIIKYIFLKMLQCPGQCDSWASSYAPKDCWFSSWSGTWLGFGLDAGVGGGE